MTDEQWARFAAMLTYVPQSAGPAALAEAVHKAEAELGADRRGRLPALPQRAAQGRARRDPPARRGRPGRAVADHHGEAVRHRPRVGGRRSTREVHEVFDEEQIFRIDHFLGKEAAQNILAFRFANGLFEPIWNRNFIDHVQIDVPETLGLEGRTAFYEAHRRLPRHGRHPPDAGAGVHGDGAADLAGAGPDQRREAQGVPLDEADRAARRRPRAVHRLPRQGGGRRRTPTPRPSSRSRSRSTTGAGPACRSSCAPARSWPRARGSSRSRSRSRRCRCSRPGSNAGTQGPDHLTFDLADQSRMSLSFYGKRPGPGHAAGEALDAVRHPRDRRPRWRSSRPTSG